MQTIIFTAAAAFAATNIDDLFINMLFFAGEDSRRGRNGVVLGKFLGMGILVAASLLGAGGMRLIAAEHLRWLGILPLAIGVRGIFRGSGDEGTVRHTSSTALDVLIVTVAGGADNIGVYLPLFSGCTSGEAAVVVCVFAAMVPVWCGLSRRLAELPVLRIWLMRRQRALVAAVCIAIGLGLLLKGV